MKVVLMTSTEVARALGVTRQTVHDWLHGYTAQCIKMHNALQPKIVGLRYHFDPANVRAAKAVYDGGLKRGRPRNPVPRATRARSRMTAAQGKQTEEGNHVSTK